MSVGLLEIGLGPSLPGGRRGVMEKRKRRPKAAQGGLRDLNPAQTGRPQDGIGEAERPSAGIAAPGPCHEEISLPLPAMQKSSAEICPAELSLALQRCPSLWVEIIL
jgi:hypothetical protein